MPKRKRNLSERVSPFHHCSQVCSWWTCDRTKSKSLHSKRWLRLRHRRSLRPLWQPRWVCHGNMFITIIAKQLNPVGTQVINSCNRATIRSSVCCLNAGQWGGKRYSKYDAIGEIIVVSLIISLIAADPRRTLGQLSSELLVLGIEVSRAYISRRLQGLNLSWKQVQYKQVRNHACKLQATCLLQ
jgi:hypothetical protein